MNVTANTGIAGVSVTLSYLGSGKTPAVTQTADLTGSTTFTGVLNQSHQVSWTDPENDKLVAVVTVIN